jgi:uncharacterized Ntn-hydrolase superfamily protein
MSSIRSCIIWSGPKTRCFLSKKIETVVDEKKGGLSVQKQYVDLVIDALLDEGFTVEEAERLIQLQDIYQQEYKKRKEIEETNYHRFIRWLVEHGRLSEWETSL